MNKAILTIVVLALICLGKISAEQVDLDINEAIDEATNEIVKQEEVKENKGNDINMEHLLNYINVYNLYSKMRHSNQFKFAVQNDKSAENIRSIKNLLLSYTDYILNQQI